MISKFIEDAYACVIENTYNNNESDIIYKSICNCFRLCEKQEFAHCKFYDYEGHEMYRCELPNYNIYHHYFVEREGIPITNYNTVILRGSGNQGISCYSIKTGSLIWESETKNVGQVFVYKEKIYYEWVIKKKVGLDVISTTTGEYLGRALDFNPSKQEVDRPDFGRLNEENIVIYILGYVYLYNIVDNILLLTSLKFDEKNVVFRLSTIKPISSHEVKFRFRDFMIQGDESVVEHKENILNIDELISSAKKSNYPSKILTNSAALDKEYKALFLE